MSQKILTLKQAAKLLGLSTQETRALIESGKLPAVTIRGRLYLDHEDVLRFNVTVR